MPCLFCPIACFSPLFLVKTRDRKRKRVGGEKDAISAVKTHPNAAAITTDEFVVSARQRHFLLVLENTI